MSALHELKAFNVRGHGQTYDEIVISTSLAQAALDYSNARSNRKPSKVEYLFEIDSVIGLGRVREALAEPEEEEEV